MIKKAKKVKRISLSLVGLVLSWIFSIFFVLSGLVFFGEGFAIGIPFILAAIVLLPPINKFVKDKFNFELSGGLKIIIVIFLILIPPFLGLGHDKTGSPPTEKSVVETCIENWQCREWSVCSATGTQTRLCSDSNACGTTINKPKELQSCTPSKIFKSPAEMLPTANELPTEFKIGEIEDISKNASILILHNASGFESGKGLSISKYKLLGSIYDYVEVGFGIYKFTTQDDAKSFYNKIINWVKSEGGYEKLSLSTIAECFAWKTDYGYEGGKTGESICNNKNVVFWVDVSMANTFQQPDSYVKDMVKIVDKKIK